MSNPEENKPEGPTKIPSLAEVQATIKKGMHNSVEATNKLLASLQHTTKSIQESPFVTNMKAMEQKGAALASDAAASGRALYVRRQEFAPHIIGGCAFLFGSIVTLRRGKLAGTFSSVLAGSLASLVVYEDITLNSAMDILFGKDNK
jgi:hypothetical protein